MATPWREAATAAARGGVVHEADLLGGIGAATLEAHAQLRGPGKLTEKGARTDAERQLARALAFYRRVGATGFLREGEALLAGAS